ncbi:hypothetical protein [Pelagicoccus mobilis]|uniref:Uncharacterized protein n=1 Tax=Pelagicoccus mobilis TaxID=415221 RepID=A0A934S1R1_9BACT|nr:hypothetical protein [Pelagicoccus mobilis]MBK1878262.1 hypothetical protein [Pelagicoccus mobilis]
MKRALIALASLFPIVASAEVSIGKAEHLGRLHYKITTETATYLYDPVAGGFSSIFDPTGQDWIAYGDPAQADYPAGAAYAFRGLPNMVHGGEDSGTGHPGFKKCRSAIVSDNRIQSFSTSGVWQWSWHFFDTHAELVIEKAAEDRAYWFLYEGPAGGKWDPDKTYWGSNQGGPKKEQHDFYNNDKRFDHFDWFYFGTDFSDYTFWMAQVESDNQIDLFSLLGNEPSGVNAPDGMVVAGFGRGPGTASLLKGPKRFLIGMRPGPIKQRPDHQNIVREIEALRKENASE